MLAFKFRVNNLICGLNYISGAKTVAAVAKLLQYNAFALYIANFDVKYICSLCIIIYIDWALISCDMHIKI